MRRTVYSQCTSHTKQQVFFTHRSPYSKCHHSRLAKGPRTPCPAVPLAVFEENRPPWKGPAEGLKWGVSAQNRPIHYSAHKMREKANHKQLKSQIYFNSYWDHKFNFLLNHIFIKQMSSEHLVYIMCVKKCKHVSNNFWLPRPCK